eukprot:4945017-Amphidinium_carterae.1
MPRLYSNGVHEFPKCFIPAKACAHQARLVDVEAKGDVNLSKALNRSSGEIEPQATMPLPHEKSFDTLPSRPDKT